MRHYADLSHFGSFAQSNLLKFGEADAKVFTTARAEWQVVSRELEGLAKL
jgi:hypothetical protein